MRAVRFAMLLAGVAAPATAQNFRYGTTVPRYATTQPPYSEAVSATFGREEAIRRAGAWGRCVLARDPQSGEAFATAPRAEALRLREAAALADAFATCLRASGNFAWGDSLRVQQAAIRDAVRQARTDAS